MGDPNDLRVTRRTSHQQASKQALSLDVHYRTNRKAARPTTDHTQRDREHMQEPAAGRRPKIIVFLDGLQAA